MFSDVAVRPALRRGCRKGWKRIGRWPDASDLAWAETSGKARVRCGDPSADKRGGPWLETAARDARKLAHKKIESRFLASCSPRSLTSRRPSPGNARGIRRAHLSRRERSSRRASAVRVRGYAIAGGARGSFCPVAGALTPAPLPFGATAFTHFGLSGLAMSDSLSWLDGGSGDGAFAGAVWRPPPEKGGRSCTLVW